MANDGAFQSYRDLLVWQAAMSLAEACYHRTKDFPREETFGLTAQIRRAAASIPANIAEGHGRENSGSFVQFLRVAQGSVKELETHLLLSGRIGLAEGSTMEPLLQQCEEIGKMLRSLIRSIQKKAQAQ
ncbi:four helix bundle protein [Amphiplicatus metriothermophilus]|uniref:Four helix bundle protein n=1 Tax=Amphiplicatus metriothermophilus TaxID=1519374 RepID=A0A239PWY7_9PROT|nr:four helix bundle protein [Amphiplicatus metriothermophilus]MBB5519634.1 four helix bundle protein [Amphiplicatus metriothermophilus]SNT74197.1 four helix bundle protein [Amphiplicatus metriothermophilus]